jgi:predicted MFS family arabinose efflux permease
MAVTTRSPAPRTVALAGLSALAVAMGIGRFAFTPILPMMQADAGLSVVEGGWLASANYAGYLLGAVLATAVPIRATTAIRVALAFTGVTTLAMAFTRGLVVWLALRALAGVASAWVLVFVSAWCLGALAPLGRPQLQSAVFAGVGVGTAVAGAVCIALMQAQATSAAAWAALGVLSLIVTALTWPIFRDPGSTVAGAETRTSPASGRSADRVRLAVCYGVFGFGYIIPATFIPAMARDIVRDPAVFGWAWPVFGITAAASTFAAALVAPVVSTRRLWALAHVVMAAGVMFPAIASGLVPILGAAALVGGTFMVATMTGMQEARRVGGAHGRVLMATMTSAFAAGQIAGPLAVSSLVQAGGGFSAALLVAAGLLAITAGALFAPGRD